MSDGTLQTLDVTMLDDVNNASGLIQLDSNAKIPACSGAAITGLSSVTKNASDPAIATNPSGGVGTVWQNTTSGEMYICTDATAGENVWTNIGEGTGDIQAFHGAGSSYGYIAGGSLGSQIERYSLVSDGNSVDTTYDLIASAGEIGSVSSSTYGYVLGSSGVGSAQPYNRIEKFNMVTPANSTDVGDLTVSDMHRCAGCMSTTYGFASGGTEPNGINTINRFPFASDANAVDWGDLTVINQQASGHSSSTYGYTSGSGNNSGINVIDKFPFASAAGATDVGDLTETAGYNAGGQQSSTYGYRSGGRVGSPNVSSNVIDKFSFTTDGNATDVGDMTVGRRMQGDASSVTHGYTAGGYGGSGPALTNTIDKHSFSVDGNSVDVGDITAISAYQSGHQI
jgi:hypothetical protein